MAPRKRKPEEPQQPAKPETPPTRVTRSMAQRLSSDSVALVKAADSPKNKKNKATGNNKQKKEEQAKTEPEKQKAEEDKKRTIVIEHCKQCRSFRTRADQVKEGLENDLEGITVLLNPEKPRRGCFEIREEGGRTFISLLNMKRPFKPMKDLDMSEVISDIIDKIKE